MDSKYVRFLEPRVDVVSETQKSHVILSGGQRVTQNVYSSLAWGSPGATPVQASWSVSPPSTQTIVDRLVRVRAFIEVKTDTPLSIGIHDAPRQFPLHSITDVLTCQLNGETISDNISEHLHALLMFGNTPEQRNKTWSTTPAMPDQFQEYSDWSDPVTGGSARNPLAGYGENSTENSRGGFIYDIAPDRLSFKCVVTEPMMLSPFYSGLNFQEEGFVNVNQLNVTFRWTSQLNRILSHSSLGSDIQQVDVSFYRAPELLVTYITPDLTQPIHSVQTLPYSKIQDYIKAVKPLAPAETTTIYSDSIKLSMIPRYAYLFVRHSRSTSNFKVSDAFLKINRCNVLFNNQSGLLSSAVPEDLYEISRRCGLDRTFSQFSKYTGSVLCIEFGKDIGLLDNLASGVQTQATLQISLDVENVSSEDFEGEFYMSILNEGLFSLFESGASASLGVLSQADVLEARMGSPQLEHHLYYSLLHGSGFFSKLKSFIGRVSKGVADVADVGSKIAGAVAPEFLPIATGVSGLARSIQKVSGGRLTTGGRLR